MVAKPLASPVLSDAEALAAVRPANLDRPLHRNTIEPKYSDPRLEEMIRVATARAREEAQAQGYLAGWAQGRQAATEENARVKAAQEETNQKLQAEIRAEAQDLLGGLRDALQQAHEAQLPEWNEVADVLTDGALKLAEAALGRELTSVDDQVALAVRTAVRRLAASEETIVHLNPKDAEALGDSQDGVPEGLTVVADTEVTAGSVLVLTPTQRLRQDLPAAIAAAEEVLRS